MAYTVGLQGPQVRSALRTANETTSPKLPAIQPRSRLAHHQVPPPRPPWPAHWCPACRSHVGPAPARGRFPAAGPPRPHAFPPHFVPCPEQFHAEACLPFSAAGLLRRGQAGEKSVRTPLNLKPRFAGFSVPGESALQHASRLSGAGPPPPFGHCACATGVGRPLMGISGKTDLRCTPEPLRVRAPELAGNILPRPFAPVRLPSGLSWRLTTGPQGGCVAY